MRQAFSKHLKCGIFAHGFARARCDDCGHDYFVAYFCKGRRDCPLCDTRRMAETAADLTDHFPVPAGASVGALRARAAALLCAARWRGFEHGAARLIAPSLQAYNTAASQSMLVSASKHTTAPL